MPRTVTLRHEDSGDSRDFTFPDGTTDDQVRSWIAQQQAKASQGGGYDYDQNADTFYDKNGNPVMDGLVAGRRTLPPNQSPFYRKNPPGEAIDPGFSQTPGATAPTPPQGASQGQSGKFDIQAAIQQAIAQQGGGSGGGPQSIMSGIGDMLGKAAPAIQAATPTISAPTAPDSNGTPQLWGLNQQQVADTLARRERRSEFGQTMAAREREQVRQALEAEKTRQSQFKLQDMQMEHQSKLEEKRAALQERIEKAREQNRLEYAAQLQKHREALDAMKPKQPIKGPGGILMNPDTNEPLPGQMDIWKEQHPPKPGKGEKEPKLYEVTVPGSDGKPMKVLVPKEKLQEGIPLYEKPPADKTADPMVSQKRKLDFQNALVMRHLDKGKFREGTDYASIDAQLKSAGFPQGERQAIFNQYGARVMTKDGWISNSYGNYTAMPDDAAPQGTAPAGAGVGLTPGSDGNYNLKLR